MLFQIFYLVMGLSPYFVMCQIKTQITKTSHVDLDILSPFSTDQEVNVRRKNRLSHSFYEVNQPRSVSAGHHVQHFKWNLPRGPVYGHRVIVSNGREMLSVLEPLESNGCRKNKLATVLQSSKQRECLVAVNAGFFNERTGQCYGNLVSDGEEMNKFRGIKSASFGISKDGSLVVGYLKETDIFDMKYPFQQLVSGVGWILRESVNYLNESLKHEQCNLENLEQFFNVKSSRTMIGHDRKGNIQIVQVDGKTGEQG